MALLKGKGAMTGVNLIARTYDNNVTKNGKTRYLDIQVDYRDPRGPSQTNLHLVSTGSERDGKTQFSNGAPYDIESQFDKMREAAGSNITPILDKDGDTIGQDLAFKGNVMPASSGKGLVVNTKSLGPSDFALGDKAMDGQFASMKAAKEAAAAAKEAGDPAVETQAEVAVEQQVEEPAVG